MSEAPKLFTSKPKKSQAKQHQQKTSASPSTSASMGTRSSSKTATPPPPPPQLSRESFARRYKFLWPLLLTVNFSVGAYLFMRTRKKDDSIGDDEQVSPGSASTATPEVNEKPPSAVEGKLSPSPPIMEPVKLLKPIPEDQQRELFKWLLDEKRKVKPKDREEKKRIDEEKALIKQFIRAESIPKL